jgi:hypothetical protein
MLSKRLHGNARAIQPISNRRIRFLAACVSLLVAVGCSTTMSFGSNPPVERLQSLQLGASTARDVRAALGEPRGPGQTRIQASYPETQIWYYEYVQSSGAPGAAKVQMKMLLVFMHEDVYVGHMWFSSGQLLGATR